jgi:hypothetical protein
MSDQMADWLSELDVSLGRILVVAMFVLIALVILAVRKGWLHRCSFRPVAMFQGGNFAERCHGCNLVKLWSEGADGQVRVRLIASVAEQEELLRVKVSPKDLRGLDLAAGDEPQAGSERGQGSWWPTRPR